ncbi:putative cell surface spherulin 4-like protein [Diaporthe ampelina]|uniref:Putative cell surface spherulin 4-like protein n=1 Tax=Diaporthe ampelina TaxID=1214573 RepID=A0A0G2FAX9_9PEZI|nr:putative cell surface spherulin 4-like protein [Diaporthe ampelina]
MKALSLTILVAAAFATSLLLPLYVWPASGACDNVYKAIEANNLLTFQIIINPDLVLESQPRISVDGIFYDEIPNEEGSSVSVAFLALLVKCAKSAFDDYHYKSIFNPGATPQHIELYDSADYIVAFESETSSYGDTVLAD